MGMQSWLDRNTRSLAGKTVAITGCYGSLGSTVCRIVLQLSGGLILIGRNLQKMQALQTSLLQEFPGAEIRLVPAELTRMESVRQACEKLRQMPVDILILNAGTYNTPGERCDTGFNHVFQTNFVSHYYMVKQLLEQLARRKGRVVAVGSIAYRFSQTDPKDRDFSGRSSRKQIYGNSKRYLMFSLMELLREHPDVSLAIAHPEICFTGITSHYPRALLVFVRCGMKLIFMHPSRACRGIVRGMFDRVPDLHWLGPGWFDIWGNPAVKKLKSCPEAERRRVFADAEQIYRQISGKEEA